MSSKYDEIIINKNTIESFKMTNIISPDHLDLPSPILSKFEHYIKNITGKKKNSKYNVLYVIDTKHLCRKMSRVRFWAIEELGQKVNLTLTGPGFLNFNINYSLQQNILNLNQNFDLIIWYKPLDYNFDKKIKLPFKTCLRYNEMWDEEWTNHEIKETMSDIIICHHQNDYNKYVKLYKNNTLHQFFYIPHFANPSVFKNLNSERTIDILLSGVVKQKHYPLKYRVFNLIMKHKDTTLKHYNIYHHKHPSYSHDNSFENVNQINYNKLINSSKLCLACTSRYNYRLGKYVEIPMAGGVIVGDLPFEDDSFNEFVVEINESMSDDEILIKIKNTLDDPIEIKNRQIKGLKWSQKFTTARYVEEFLNNVISQKKIFIISDEIRENHPEFKNQKWICDQLKYDFIENNPYDTPLDPKKADIVWYLAPWNYKFTPSGFKHNEWLEFLKTKKVIATQHHVDQQKMTELRPQFDFMNKYVSTIHAICKETEHIIKSHFPNKKIILQHLWINDKIFYYRDDKEFLRLKYNFDKNAFLIGSFQKDTEGKTNKPKLSKGPDLFVNIIKDLAKTYQNIEVVLTGLRRDYIINEFKKCGIKYHYFNMVDNTMMNDLYNLLDLYIVSSRCEGGPRSVFEAGVTKTPIISTRVGISPELMNATSLFDADNWLSYKNCKPDIKFLYENVNKLLLNKYLHDFKNNIFNV
jgi:glycosyltransferase involved in cell wall biosynthesis